MKLPNTIQYLILALILTSHFACSYLPEVLPENIEIIQEETADYILLQSNETDDSKAAIIFYPGGLVDPHAYISALQAFVVTDNRSVVIIKAGANLAILNAQKASKIIPELPNIERWIVGGHSLGGAVSCIDVANNSDSFEALFLLAAYSTSDISEIDVPVLSITASEDLVLDQERFEETSSNLPVALRVNDIAEIPENSTSGQSIYYEIAGGNHAQFGSYGEQNGDGKASISPELQQSMVVDAVRKFLESNAL